MLKWQLLEYLADCIERRIGQHDLGKYWDNYSNLQLKRGSNFAVRAQTMRHLLKHILDNLL